MKSLFFRPLQLVGLVFALALMGALVALAVFTWFDFDRVQSVREHVHRTRLLQAAEDALQRAQAGTPAFTADGDPLIAVRRSLDQIPVLGGPIGTVTGERLKTMDRLLAEARTRPEPTLTEALALVDTMLERETRIQGELLDAVVADVQLERRMALLALVGFPSLVVLALWVLRQRIFRPIDNLRALLSGLAQGNFSPVPLRGIEPLLHPLFENYNQMVTRLAQLEHVNRTRTQSLEQEVRSAAGALLKQQQSLARAERLATAGEVSASLAHELRNPLAGMHVTLANLQAEIEDPEAKDRIRLVLGELQRITRLLNGLLQQTRHAPEPSRSVDVAALVRELATLVRHQLPPQVRLDVAVQSDLRCRVPEDGLRQALLNLVLNAVEAIGPAPGTVRLDAGLHEGRLRLRVQDDGPGFPDEWLRDGARPFTTSRESGTGLGLAIVRRFARDLEGDLQLANVAPRGACVVLTLACHG